MDFLYRNKNPFPVSVVLGGEKKVVLPNATLLVPEQYDYVITKRKVLLVRDLAESISIDEIKNPEEWIQKSDEELVSQALEELKKHTEEEKKIPAPTVEIKKPGRKKKKETK